MTVLEEISTTRMKVGDTYSFQHQMVWDDGSYVDLTTADTVYFEMWDESDPDNPLVSATCLILTPASGIVRYNWIDGETDTAGMYRICFIANFNTGDTLTNPSGGEMYLWIMDK